MAAEAFAAAKLNMFLHVAAPGEDGYHPLCSLMAFADVGDRLTARDGDAISLSVHGPFAGSLAHETDNLVMRAARALLARARGPVPPVELVLEKRLPVASGLGGGSADAGAALRLLRQVLGLRVSDDELEELATSLGADGAPCLWGRPVLAEGRGERLSPAPRMPTVEAVLVNPRVPVSTAEVYRRFDAADAFSSVEPPPMPESFESVEELAAWLNVLRNDLQAPAIEIAPEVGDVLGLMAEEPECLLARMSGSGATCFALCPGDLEADALAARIAALRPAWWTVRCRLGGPWD